MHHLLKGNPLILVVAFVFLLAGLTGAVSWQLASAEGDTPGQQVDEMEDVEDVHDTQGVGPVGQVREETHRTADDRLVSIGATIPGYGGQYIDQANPDVLNVFLLDTDDEEQQRAAIEAAIRAEFPHAIPPGGIAIVQGDYSIIELKAWYDDVIFALASSGLVLNGMTFADLAEHANRIDIGVENEELASQVRELAAEADIPPDAIRVFVSEPVRFRNGPSNATVRDRFRPNIGGIQTQGENKGYCTQGFVVIRSGVLGSVVNLRISVSKRLFPS